MKSVWEQKVMPFILKYYKYAIAGAAVALVLAFAFWYGAGTKDSQGFNINKETVMSAEGTEAGLETEAIVSQTAEGISLENTSVPESASSSIEADETESTEAVSGENIENREGTQNESDAGNVNGSVTAGGSAQGGTSAGGSAQGSTTGGNAQGSATGGNTQGSTSTGGNTQGGTSTGGNTQGSTSTGGNTSKPQETTEESTDKGSQGNNAGSNTVETTAAQTLPTEPEKKELSCTISISCATILNNMADLTPGKEAVVPADGWILRPVTVSFSEDESVFDVLKKATRSNGIHFEYSYTPLYGSMYIEGINNIYEFDCGSLSGWMYSVNGVFPNYGCSSYVLNDGDNICWVYTCNLGYDVGGGYSTGS